MLDTPTKNGGGGFLGGVSPLDWINAGSKVLGAALSPAPTQSTSGISGGQSFDNSGFNVAFGGGSASSSAGLSPWIVGGGIAAAALVGLVLVKRAWPKKSA